MVPARGTSSRISLNLLIDFHAKSPLFAKLTPAACRPRTRGERRSLSDENLDLSCLWECLCSSLQHNHFFCNKNTNPDLRPSSGLGKRKESKKLLAGNTLCVFKSKLEALCHTQHWKPSTFQIGKVNLHKHLG